MEEQRLSPFCNSHTRSIINLKMQKKLIEVVMTMKNKSTAGPGGLSNTFVKAVARDISPYMAHIINNCVDSSKVI